MELLAWRLVSPVGSVIHRNIVLAVELLLALLQTDTARHVKSVAKARN